MTSSSTWTIHLILFALYLTTSRTTFLGLVAAHRTQHLYQQLQVHSISASTSVVACFFSKFLSQSKKCPNFSQKSGLNRAWEINLRRAICFSKTHLANWPILKFPSTFSSSLSAKVCSKMCRQWATCLATQMEAFTITLNTSITSQDLSSLTSFTTVWPEVQDGKLFSACEPQQVLTKLALMVIS